MILVMTSAGKFSAAPHGGPKPSFLPPARGMVFVKNGVVRVLDNGISVVGGTFLRILMHGACMRQAGTD